MGVLNFLTILLEERLQLFFQNWTNWAIVSLGGYSIPKILDWLKKENVFI